MKTSIILEQPDLFQTWEINVCSMAKYNHHEGSITIEFTDRIMPYLTQVSRKFVLYNLKEVANFGSLYTTRLYELIQEFKDTGYIVKSVEQLRTVFAVGNKYVEYRDFKRYTFLHAANEINSQFDMKLSFEEIKDGRKVVAIKFNFVPTFIIHGVDKMGNPKNVYVKPKRKKVIETEKPKEDLTKTDLPL
jgi:plasmid replication initiation protein